MAEVLGIVTGALQLLDTALKLTEVAKDAYRAPQEKQEIHDELKGLKPLLAEVELRVSASPSQRVLGNMVTPLAKFKKTLEELCSRLQSTKNTFERFKWALSEKKRMKEDILAFRQFHDMVNSWMILDFWYVSMNHNVDLLSLSAQRLAMIEWLSPLNFSIRQQDISRTRQPGTGEWLLKDPKFKEWELGAGGVLWCSGIPGAGKTVLASLVVDHLTSAQTKNPDIGIACIYFNHKETQVQTLENLLAALWRQLIFKQPLGPASDLYAQLVEKKTKPTSTETQKVLLHALQRFKQIYIIIDAIDEHPEKERHSLAGILTKLSRNINLLVTARPHIAPNREFSQISRLEIQATTKDLEVYIKAQIEASPHLSQHIAHNRELESKIFSVLCNSVCGMFLLAKLHLEALDAAPNIDALQHALKTLPTDLHPTYENILSRIKCLCDTQKEIARSALVWVAYAKKPLTAMELCEAIAIEPATTILNKDKITRIQNIIHLCTGLIILDEQSSLVRLVHFTAQDYLDKVQQQEFPFAHVQITRALDLSGNFFLSSSTASLNSSQWSLILQNTLSDIPVGQHLSSFSLNQSTMESIHVSDLNDVQLHQIGEESASDSLYSLVEARSASFYRTGNGGSSSFVLVEPEDQENNVPVRSSPTLPFTVDYMSIGSISGGIGGRGGQGGHNGGRGGNGEGPQLLIPRVGTLNITVTGTLCLHAGPTPA
ncbi:hypothetical protein R3P38DRAFT_3450977, partial [Favolaschia claudopus]